MANKYTVHRPIIEPKAVRGARWIALTQDKWALVDEEDYERLSRHSWCYIKGRHENATGYAQTNLRLNVGQYMRVTMHRFLTSNSGQVDHKNGNGLDNRKVNLRLVTNTQNRRNSQSYKSNQSGYKGVTLHAGKYRATIVVNKKQKHLGRFATAEEAAYAYDAAARQYFGEHAKTNFGEYEDAEG